MYRTGRYGAFRYEIPVPAGSYQVFLHFAETSLTTVGARIFHIDIEDVPTYQNFDIVARSGGVAFRALTVASQVRVDDGLLSIAFRFTTPGRNSPIVSGIEVIRQETVPDVPRPTKVPTRAPVLAPIRAPVPVSKPDTCSIPRVSTFYIISLRQYYFKCLSNRTLLSIYLLHNRSQRIRGQHHSRHILLPLLNRRVI
jgi:hypothetical protein